MGTNQKTGQLACKLRGGPIRKQDSWQANLEGGPIRREDRRQANLEGGPIRKQGIWQANLGKDQPENRAFGKQT